jgi:hypothetical protein
MNNNLLLTLMLFSLVVNAQQELHNKSIQQINGITVNKLLASDGLSQDRLGTSASISGNIAAFGAPFYDSNGLSNNGAVYVYTFDGSIWQETAIITALNASDNDEFGHSISLDGNRLLVAAPYKTVNAVGNTGAAYIFDFDGTNWNQTEQLDMSSVATQVINANFGISVSLLGDKALVGAYKDNSSAVSNAGAAYVFSLQTGSWNTDPIQLLANDAAVNDKFGFSVSLSPGKALIGAFGHGGKGAAYVFTNTSVLSIDSFLFTSKITDTAGVAGDSFGYSVSLDGQRAIIGANGQDIGGSSAGAAFIYDYNNTTSSWDKSFTLIASDAANFDKFGTAVDLSGNFAIVSSPYKFTSNSVNNGKIYMYRKLGPNWQEINTFIPTFTSTQSELGKSIELGVESVAAGAWSDNEKDIEAGAGYVFQQNDIIFSDDFE